MKVGDSIKVHLPGESPWADVVEIHGPQVKARIANRLVAEWTLAEREEWKASKGFDIPIPAHSYRQGDEVWFERDEELRCFMPSPT